MTINYCFYLISYVITATVMIIYVDICMYYRYIEININQC